MADEENENAPGAKKGSGSIIKFAVLGLVILVAMSGGFATWNFMLRPMLAPPMLDEVEAATTNWAPALVAALAKAWAYAWAVYWARAGSST